LKEWIGQHSFGWRGWVEYVQGNLPIVLCAPHGGLLEPKEISVRKDGVLDGDKYTAELTCEMMEYFAQIYGNDVEGKPLVPHAIFCHLDRSRIDANRSKSECANDTLAFETWDYFHSFIEIAKRNALKSHGFVHVFDVHGNTASVKVMLGHLIRKVEFETSSEEELLRRLDQSSIRQLAATKKTKEEKLSLLLGENSLGYLLEKEGIPSTPVGQKPFNWGGEIFFNGGYNTWRHGSCKTSEKRVNSTQIETPIHLRENPNNRETFAKVFASAAHKFIKKNYHF
jgi:hypothetical protein